MIANKFANLGPGDAATWPPFAQPSARPAGAGSGATKTSTLDTINDARGFLAIAEVAAKKATLERARYALSEACSPSGS